MTLIVGSFQNVTSYIRDMINILFKCNIVYRCFVNVLELNKNAVCIKTITDTPKTIQTVNKGYVRIRRKPISPDSM